MGFSQAFLRMGDWRMALLLLYICGTYRAFELSSISLQDLSQVDPDTVRSQLQDCEALGNEVKDEVMCSRLEYVSRFMALRDNTLQDSHEPPHRLHEVAEISESTDYQTIFENFILKNR